MPFVVRWPGQIQPASFSNEIICHVDMLATFAAIVGQQLPKTSAADSHNLLPVLLGKKRNGPVREATIFQSSGRVQAVRQGPWKFIPRLGSCGFSQPRFEKPTKGGPTGQLYNLADDPGETKNLFVEHPEIVKRLQGIYSRYEKKGFSRPVN